MLHGLYWLTANLAARDPLLIAVDDAHWADPASLRFLNYLARRLDGLTVLLVVAARPTATGSGAALRAARGDAALRPAPLTPGRSPGGDRARPPRSSSRPATR
ncbi:ATP-binding protein [Pseudonocardia asaccharolytica]|uniref:Orc1-like AAA ATPase domain-containing protein n=1 Tax=Pseudonocardia asaccharolytica DSM 44247 = NBRC 16224 TaxID=1123024 RepID=A0A511D399_9PSEU|nr:ATP-binding protein [Pseudonocardia asaccharolytica]GEL19259.1 hypothetical protein PA7_30960 [Pseudonocardia asaccharolytica DSM 44247 = NBRC 16224]